ncbi:MAG: hypothetical protein ACP5QU_01720 [Anaerolineae bacterium]
MRHLSVFLIVAFALLLSACGTSGQQSAPIVAAPTQNPGADPAAPASPSPMGESSTSSSPTEVAPGDPSSGPVPVQVTLGDMWVKSDVTTFKVGVTYAFTVTNVGRREHNFSISHPAEKNPTAINAARANALFSISEDDLKPGLTQTFAFVFKEPAPAGTLEFACLIPRHYIMGQYLSIVVEP